MHAFQILGFLKNPFVNFIFVQYSLFIAIKHFEKEKWNGKCTMHEILMNEAKSETNQMEEENPSLQT